MNYLHTNHWCMLPLGVTGYLKDWLDNRPFNMPGNNEDGYNVLLVVVPDKKTLSLADRVVDLREMAFDYELEYAGQLVEVIGSELIKSGNVVIIGTKGQFSAAHNTAYWRLWCGLYESESDPQFTADKNNVGFDIGLKIAEARQETFRYFSNVNQ